jgi:hypothetical protein
MYRQKIQHHKPIVVPKNNTDPVQYDNKPKINKNNQNYENIRSIVQNENQNIKNITEKQNKQKLNIV